VTSLLPASSDRKMSEKYYSILAEKIKRKRVKRAWRIIPATIIISITFLVVFHVNYVINVAYPYNKKIGAYLANAYDASTLELMKENYIRAKQGMIDEGLTPDLYGKWFDWEKTADWHMNYTYQYIDGLIARCDYYINQTKQANISPFTDIYNQMIQNLRDESQRNGPVDWAAWPAWEIKYAPLYYLAGMAVWTFTLAACLVIILIAVAYALESEYDIETELKEKSGQKNED